MYLEPVRGLARQQRGGVILARHILRVLPVREGDFDVAVGKVLAMDLHFRLPRHRPLEGLQLVHCKERYAYACKRKCQQRPMYTAHEAY